MRSSLEDVRLSDLDTSGDCSGRLLWLGLRISDLAMYLNDLNTSVDYSGGQLWLGQRISDLASYLHESGLWEATVSGTHSDIEQHIYFRHDEQGRTRDLPDRETMYKTRDQLFRGELSPADLPPLEVVQDEGRLWSLSNIAVFIRIALMRATWQH